MGRTKGAYKPEFPIGTIVRVANRDVLEDFKREWRLHHPLAAAQLDFAGGDARVKQVSFYHGGDELYELEGVPGLWHEQLLSASSSAC